MLGNITGDCFSPTGEGMGYNGLASPCTEYS